MLRIEESYDVTAIRVSVEMWCNELDGMPEGEDEPFQDKI